MESSDLSHKFNLHRIINILGVEKMKIWLNKIQILFSFQSDARIVLREKMKQFLSRVDIHSMVYWYLL